MPAAPTAIWIARLLDRDVEGFERELVLFPDESLIWRSLPGVTNSAGTLTLHVCGNLQFFVGRVLGGTAYVRDRPLEFGARGVPRADLLASLQNTRAVVRQVVPALSDAALAEDYPQRIGDVSMATGQFLAHLAAHLAFHLGQVGYLRRILTGANQPAGVLPLDPLGR